MKLSKTQEEVLSEMQKGAIAHYMRYMGRFNPNSYYFLSTNYRKCTKQIEALSARGLVEEIKKNDFGDHQMVISQKGKEYAL